MVVDVWSRKIIAAQVFAEESMEHSSRLLARACLIHGVQPESLLLHSDNGAPMKGATMLATLQRLGVTASFSRPSVSNDNPYSESLFRTLKYRPDYPSKPFESLEQAQAWYEKARYRNPNRWSKRTRDWSPVRLVRLNPEKGDVAAKTHRLKKADYTTVQLTTTLTLTGGIVNF